MLVQQHDLVRAGERLTDGAINPHDILRIKGAGAVQEYLVNEIQEVYRMQGVKINDKHIEVIVRQMMQKVRISAGRHPFPGRGHVDQQELREVNEESATRSSSRTRATRSSKRSSRWRRRSCVKPTSISRRGPRNSGDVPRRGPGKLRAGAAGITPASLTTDSWISAASFQETTKVLTDAAIEGKMDNLLGLKENVIIGHLIPAGTGLKKFRNSGGGTAGALALGCHSACFIQGRNNAALRRLRGRR